MRGAQKSSKKLSAGAVKERFAMTDELRAAFNDFQSQHERKQRKRRGKQHHVDDYRELVLDSSSTTGLSEALSQLVTETRQNRARLLPEEKPIISLAGGTNTSNRKEAAREAESASKDLKVQMAKRGIEERTHYYSASERRETGEIDRTYEIKRSG